MIEKCRNEGLLIISAGEKVLRLAPPLTIEYKEMEKAVEIIERALNDA